MFFLFHLAHPHCSIFPSTDPMPPKSCLIFSSRRNKSWSCKNSCTISFPRNNGIAWPAISNSGHLSLTEGKTYQKVFHFFILFPDDVVLINHTVTCQAGLVGEKNFCLKHYTHKKKCLTHYTDFKELRNCNRNLICVRHKNKRKNNQHSTLLFFKINLHFGTSD